MNFHELPDGWDQAPIHTADRVADVLDLLLGEQDRRSGAVLVVICDHEGHYGLAHIVPDLPASTTADEKRQLVGVFASAAEEVEPRAGLLVAIARADGLSLTPDDRDWGAAVQQVCEAVGVQMLGVHLVTRHGTRPIAA